MLQLIILFILAGSFLLAGVLLIINGIKRKRMAWVVGALISFLFCVGVGGVAVYQLVTKSYNKVVDLLKPRTGEEIYDALFEKRKYDCVKVLQWKDQVVPRLDNAIWLEFVTCSKEFMRIHKRHPYDFEKVKNDSLWADLPSDAIAWFDVKSLGDSVLKFNYISSTGNNQQTLWVNLDTTKVFCRDMAD